MKDVADKLRAKGGIEWRQAILADQRVEYIRGKDFAAHFKQHEEQMLTWVSRGKSPTSGPPALPDTIYCH